MWQGALVRVFRGAFGKVHRGRQAVEHGFNAVAGAFLHPLAALGEVEGGVFAGEQYRDHGGFFTRQQFAGLHQPFGIVIGFSLLARGFFGGKFFFAPLHRSFAVGEFFLACGKFLFFLLQFVFIHGHLRRGWGCCGGIAEFVHGRGGGGKIGQAFDCRRLRAQKTDMAQIRLAGGGVVGMVGGVDGGAAFLEAPIRQ